MPEKKSTRKPKRLPKGQRTHTRRLKQVARKEIELGNPYAGFVQPVRVHKKQEQS